MISNYEKANMDFSFYCFYNCIPHINVLLLFYLKFNSFFTTHLRNGKIKA